MNEKISQKDKTTIADTFHENPILVMKELVKRDLYFFIKYFWDTYSKDPFVGNWHIKYIAKECETLAKRVANREEKEDIIINIPPGTTKTATVSIFFPIWCWVNWYWMRFITSSHSSPLSLESAEYSRDIIRSEKFQEMFPEIDVKQDKDKKSNFRVVKKVWKKVGKAPRILQGGGRVSTSVEAKVTGFHAHIIIADDLVDPHSALSEAGLRRAIRHLDQGLSTRKVDKKSTAMVLIMQRLSQGDPTGHLLKKERKDLKHICLPGEIAEYEKFVKPPELKEYYVNQLLDENRLGWKELDALKKDLGQYGYAGQIGQNPTPAGGGMFKVDNFQIVEQYPPEVHIKKTVRYWDKAGTAGGGAYTVGVKLAQLIDGTFIVLDVTRGQWGSSEREKIIRRCAEIDGEGCTIYVEQEPGSGGKESAEGTIKNLAGYNVYADRPTGDKVYRADPFSVQVNNGNVSLLKASWNKVYLDELENFPLSMYKDQTDASSGAFAKLVKFRKVKIL